MLLIRFLRMFLAFESFDLRQLMDGEGFDKGEDGEPSNGRILADTHLDYIYTQSHTP